MFIQMKVIRLSTTFKDKLKQEEEEEECQQTKINRKIILYHSHATRYPTPDSLLFIILMHAKVQNVKNLTTAYREKKYNNKQKKT